MANANPWSDAPASAPPASQSLAQGTTRADAIDVDSLGCATPLATVESADSRLRVHSTGMENKNQMLLLVFIHGFKGSSETTFEDFPSRISHVLSETYRGLHVQPVIYPTYDTRGSLTAAVDAFVEWITEQCVTLESKPVINADTGEVEPNTGRGGGMGSVKVVLAGHSMGGLVAVDAALSIIQNSARETGTTSAAAIWPRVCGVIAYDTPYYGVHPGVFKNGFNKYAGYVQTAQTLGAFFAPMGVGLAARWNANRTNTEDNPRADAAGTRSASAPAAQPTTGSGQAGWGSWFGQSGSASPATQQTASSRNENASGSGWHTALMATGAVALAGGAAASAAYFNKEIGGAYGWVSDHLMFVSNLWDDKALRKRLDDLVQQPQILFHCFYTRLPSNKLPGPSSPQNDAPTKTSERTFVILPPRNAQSAALFTPMDNSKAANEVDAHISMFNAKGNPLYFDLGLRTANLIALCLDNESQHGNQVNAQRETREQDANGEVEEEKGLRFGDEEVEQMAAENKEEDLAHNAASNVQMIV